MKRKISLCITYTLIIIIFIFVLFFVAKKGVYLYYPLKYDEYIEEYSGKYNLNKYFVCALIFTESEFNPNAVSVEGAIGLMQITFDTKDWILQKNGLDGIPDECLYDPELNIEIGCMILQSHFNEFKSLENVLIAYNAGRGNLLNWLNNSEYSADGENINVIPFEETEQYINKINRLTEIYKLLYDKEN